MSTITWSAGVPGVDLTQEGHAVAVRKGHVQEQDVRGFAIDELEAARSRRRLAHDFDGVRIEDQAEALSEQVMVVDEAHPRPPRRRAVDA